MITAIVVGAEDVIAALKKAQKEIENNLYQALKAGAILVETAAKESMMGTGKPHIPSAPHEPPAVETGKLRASITYDVTKPGLGQEIIGKVGVRGGTEPDTQNYGFLLEFGTPKMQMIERPFLRPALRSKIEEIRELLKNGVKKVTK